MSDRFIAVLGLGFLAGIALERFVQQQRRREEARDAKIAHLGHHVAELLDERRSREGQPAPVAAATA